MVAREREGERRTDVLVEICVPELLACETNMQFLLFTNAWLVLVGRPDPEKRESEQTVV